MRTGHAGRWLWKWKRFPAEALAAALLLSNPALAQGEGFGIGAAAASRKANQPQTGLKIIPLTLMLSDGRKLTYKVEVAETDQQQQTGMMWRTHMAPKTGMLFPYTMAQPMAYWMRNTLIPLDIIYISPDRRVMRIWANTVPKSEKLLESGGRAIAVLELAGGESARIGLKVGDGLRW